MFDIRENFLELQYKGILMIAKETPRKYFSSYRQNGIIYHDIVPHIEIRFKNIRINISRWIIIPIVHNFKDTIDKFFGELDRHYCTNRQTTGFYSKLEERLSNGDFDVVLDCDIVTGLMQEYNAPLSKYKELHNNEGGRIIDLGY